MSSPYELYIYIYIYIAYLRAPGVLPDSRGRLVSMVKPDILVPIARQDG